MSKAGGDLIKGIAVLLGGLLIYDAVTKGEGIEGVKEKLSALGENLALAQGDGPVLTSFPMPHIAGSPEISLPYNAGGRIGSGSYEGSGFRLGVTYEPLEDPIGSLTGYARERAEAMAGQLDPLAAARYGVVADYIRTRGAGLKYDRGLYYQFLERRLI